MAEVRSARKAEEMETTFWILCSRQSGDINQHQMCILEVKKTISSRKENGSEREKVEMSKIGSY